jgi:mono/diheme cytochrome c family protein
MSDDPVTRVVRPFPFVVLLLLLLPGATPAADLESGAILRLQADGQSDARVAPTVALFVPEGQPVSPFLPAGSFTARFEAVLVLDKRSRLVFTLEGTGTAQLSIDDEVLVDAIGKSNDSERISSGEHKLVVEYTSPPQGDAQLRLFWEERDFAREPLPASAVLHDPSDAELAAHESLRSGRNALAERRCVSCHEPSGEITMLEMNLKGPSLAGVEKRLRQDWLAKWIADPKALRPSAHMPIVFAADADKKAADIAAYLSAGAPEMETASEATAEQVIEGGHLFHQQGCIACHTLDEKGDDERIGLKSIGKKFRFGALAQFLRAPAEFHQSTRMPAFGFSDEEATALTGFLRSLEDDPGTVVPVGDAEKGKQLFTSSGCLNCHDRGDEKSTLPPAKPLLDLTSSVCRQMSFGAGKSHPGIEAFLGNQTAQASLGRSVPAEFAHRQFASLRCNACHSQNGSEPLREKFAAEVEHLKPPAPPVDEEKPAIETGPPPLNHLGLKLRPEWRERLFAGEIDPKVRKWLPARMPAYPSRAGNLSAGFSHVAGLTASSPPDPALDPDKVRSGEAMIGVQNGLGCVTCHGVGDKPAIAVFEGEGPNFEDSGARLRREYFQLWMNDPARAWPGTIMPKYAVDGRTPLTQHYDGDSRLQFEAIYEYLRSLSEK